MKKIRHFLTAVVCLTLVGMVFLYIHLTMPGWYARLWYPLDHAGIIVRSSRAHDLDPALIAAVIYTESSFDNGNTSRAGAVGLMQLMPATAEWIAAKKDTPIEPGQLDDPAINIEYGCWYLRYLLDRFGDQRLALAAYNAGAENVESWRATAAAAGRDFDYTRDIPYHETSDYVTLVKRAEAVYQRAYPEELGSM